MTKKTKKEIVKTISEHVELTQLQTKKLVQRMFDAIIDSLTDQGRIELRNFGVFEVKKRASRRARNPRSGERVDVPAKLVVTFKPGKEMEQRVCARSKELEQLLEARESRKKRLLEARQLEKTQENRPVATRQASTLEAREHGSSSARESETQTGLAWSDTTIGAVIGDDESQRIDLGASG